MGGFPWAFRSYGVGGSMAWCIKAAVQRVVLEALLFNYEYEFMLLFIMY